MEVEQSFPNPQEGRNWTVAVVKAPKEWVILLKRLLSSLEGCKECMIPHYTVRGSSGDSVFISLRVLRRPQDEGYVKSKIAELLGDYEYAIDPEKGERLFEYHAWIPKRETSAMWTKERCVILNKMSKFTLEIMESGAAENDRLQWGHLFSNMLAIFDLMRLYQSPESQGLKSSYYFDTRNIHLREAMADYLRSLVGELIPRR
jgi:hypothetical protein